MSSVARFDTWQAADGTNVARFSGGALEVWDGAAWITPPGNAVISGTTGSPTVTSGTAIGGVTYDIYQFTGDGSITVDNGGFVEVLIIGGGGGGGLGASGSSRAGGGAGAGGYFEETVFIPAGTATVTVGAGGASATSANNPGLSGGLSSLGEYLGISGGGGGSWLVPWSVMGGSVGGAGSSNSVTGQLALQGFTGGAGNTESSGGGGGASAVGANATANNGGNGGDGLASSITGSSVTRAGGGAGTGLFAGGTGGSGGGGDAGSPNGTTNTGSGGFGGFVGGTAGGSGGSGIVIVRVAV